jgi:hypothetical protein
MRMGTCRVWKCRTNHFGSGSGGFLCGFFRGFDAQNPLIQVPSRGRDVLIEHGVVIDLRLDEQNTPSVQVLLAIGIGLAALFFVALVLLRLKANFDFSLFGS